ncbi:unnamed protein product, partial [Trichogramma brassicae]
MKSTCARSAADRPVAAANSSSCSSRGEMAGKDGKLEPQENDIILQGFMVKRSQNKKRFTPVNYKQRWFVLTRQHLVYYDGCSNEKMFFCLQIEEIGGTPLQDVQFKGTTFVRVRFTASAHSIYYYYNIHNVSNTPTWTTAKNRNHGVVSATGPTTAHLRLRGVPALLRGRRGESDEDVNIYFVESNYIGCKKSLSHGQMRRKERGRIAVESVHLVETATLCGSGTEVASDSSGGGGGGSGGVPPGLPFQVGYREAGQEYTLYLVAPREQDRAEWIRAIRADGEYYYLKICKWLSKDNFCSDNPGLSGRFHTGFWSGKRWSCCRMSTRSAEGCDTCSPWSNISSTSTSKSSVAALTPSQLTASNSDRLLLQQQSSSSLVGASQLAAGGIIVTSNGAAAAAAAAAVAAISNSATTNSTTCSSETNNNPTSVQSQTRSNNVAVSVAAPGPPFKKLERGKFHYGVKSNLHALRSRVFRARRWRRRSSQTRIYMCGSRARRSYPIYAYTAAAHSLYTCNIYSSARVRLFMLYSTCILDLPILMLSTFCTLAKCSRRQKYHIYTTKMLRLPNTQISSPSQKIFNHVVPAVFLVELKRKCSIMWSRWCYYIHIFFVRLCHYVRDCDQNKRMNESSIHDAVRWSAAAHTAGTSACSAYVCIPISLSLLLHRERSTAATAAVAAAARQRDVCSACPLLLPPPPLQRFARKMMVLTALKQVATAATNAVHSATGSSHHHSSSNGTCVSIYCLRTQILTTTTESAGCPIEDWFVEASGISIPDPLVFNWLFESGSTENTIKNYTLFRFLPRLQIEAALGPRPVVVSRTFIIALMAADDISSGTFRNGFQGPKRRGTIPIRYRIKIRVGCRDDARCNFQLASGKGIFLRSLRALVGSERVRAAGVARGAKLFVSEYMPYAPHNAEHSVAAAARKRQAYKCKVQNFLTSRATEVVGFEHALRISLRKTQT